MDKATTDIVQEPEANVDTRQRTIENGKKTYTVPKLCHCMDCGKSFTRKSSLIVHQRIHTGEKLFMCTECGKRFGLKSSMVRHMRTHTPKTLKICPDCGKCFNRCSSLFQHQKVHRKDRPYRCPYCEKSFTRASQLVVHQRIHKRRPLLQRAECEESMKNLDKRTSQNIVCSECGEHFRGPTSLMRHQRMHKESTTTAPNSVNDAHNTLLNKDCNVPQALQPTNRLDQMRDGTFYAGKKTCEVEKRVLCMDCGKSFTRKSSLIVHQRIHTGEKLFMCSECGKRFGLKSSMVRHMRTHTPKILAKHQKLHRREKPYKCPQCQKSFSRPSQLIVHEKNHKIETFYPKSEPEDSNLLGKENDRYEDKNAEKSHMCLECGKCFTRQTALKSHQRIHKGNSCLVNTQNSIFHPDTESGTNCSTSEAVYKDGTEAPKKVQPDVTQQVNPKKSYIVIKFGDNTDWKSSQEAKNVLCMDCGKCFTRKSSLIVHQRIHTGEKLFMCADCGKRFSLKSSLVRHTRTHSPKILNICTECGKCFSRYSSFFQHQKVHRRQKPYKCPLCERSFSQASQLFFHQRTHQVEQSYPKSEPREDTDGQHKVNYYVIDNRVEEPHGGVECGNRFTERHLMIRHQIAHVDNSESSSFADPKHNADSNIPHLQAESHCKSLAEVDMKNVKSQDQCNVVSTDTESEKTVKRDCALDNSICKPRLSSSRRSYHCIQCGKNFTRKSSLIVHQSIHTGEKLFTCTECGKRFGFKSSLVRHLRTHTGKMFNICSECGIYFSRYCDLLLHLENHVGELQFTHNELSKMKMRDESLNAQKGVVTEPLINEEESGRSRDTGYVLPIASSRNDCSDPHHEDKIQQETLNIKEETSENLSADGEPTSSQKNEHACTDPSTVYGRNKTNISESFIEECSGKRLTTKNYSEQPMLDVMKTHILGRGVLGGSDHILRRSQSREKCFLCSECGKNFTRKSSLIVHQRIHTGEKLFMCTECGKRFGLKSSLVRHTRTHRTECFKCMACRKNFRDYSKFLEHQTSHPGGLPYTEPELSVN
ncbi:zinc finger protein 271-like isoform X2 [Eleutherodactylus coqui]|uniref:zinc finger protein 271-like isoform X2 n=1 Tax=Eleutherodactylus coqui TaxID=57060 RepID=UPI003461C104